MPCSAEVWSRALFRRLLRGSALCIALAPSISSEAATAWQAPAKSQAEQPEVRVEEPLPQDLVAPAEPLPSKPMPGPGESLEPLPAGPERNAEASEKELLETVLRWAEAWGEQQVEGYLSFYADDFETPQQMPRRAWESLRRERLSSPSFIRVTVQAPTVRQLGESRGQVEFIQRYESDRYRDVVRKTLHLTREGESWKILQEQAESVSGG